MTPQADGGSMWLFSMGSWALQAAPSPMAGTGGRMGAPGMCWGMGGEAAVVHLFLQMGMILSIVADEFENESDFSIKRMEV